MKKDDKTNEILQHLEKYGITDKDSFAGNRDVKKKKRFKKSDESRICKLDLHGLTTREAARSLRITLDSCRQRGVRKILVIHGKGYHSDSESGPVLKKLVHQMLENELAGLIRSFRPAKLNEGGEGATLVTLQP
ncbi:MAG: Smr/MutS family protein [Chitinispirillaceae bacterium]|nr:Smr/MutS family protein [Chitinispirillaceae bacterium]